jgi:hypothetical protein
MKKLPGLILFLFLLMFSLGGCGDGSDDSPVVIMSQSAGFAFVANYNDGTVSMHTVDAETGGLRHNGYVIARTNPHRSPSPFRGIRLCGEFQVRHHLGLVSTRPADFDCRGAPVATGDAPRSVTVEPQGRFAYAATVVPTRSRSIQSIRPPVPLTASDACACRDRTFLGHGRPRGECRLRGEF